jgi:hypothetical protein
MRDSGTYREFSVDDGFCTDAVFVPIFVFPPDLVMETKNNCDRLRTATSNGEEEKVLEGLTKLYRK